jgi:MFS family permease
VTESLTRAEPRAGTRRVVLSLVVAVIAFAVQQTSVVPAVHTVQTALHGSQEWSSWLVTVYLIVATAATPAMGRLGDLYGRRRMLLTGLGVFAIASLGATAAPSLPLLLACRALQGVGGSVYPLALALARDTVPKELTNRVVSALTAAFGVGTALGFVGGGLVAAYASWRLIFAGGAVLVIAGMLVAWRMTPSEQDRAAGGYDVVGTIVLTVAAVALLSGLTVVVSRGWRSPLTLGLFALAALGGAYWVRHERRTDDPLIDIGIFRDRRVVAANAATIGLGWALFGSYLLVPQMIRADPGTTGYGLSASAAAIGLLLVPLAIGQTLAAPLAGALERRLPARVVYAAGLLATAAGLAVLCAAQRSAVLVGIAVFILGAGAGAALQAGSSVATSDVAPDVAAASTAANSTIRRLAGGIGGQTDTILLTAFAATLTAPPSFGGFVLCYLLAAVLCLVGAGLVWRLR